MRHFLLLLIVITSSGCTTARSLSTDLSAKPVSSDQTAAALTAVLAEATEERGVVRTFRAKSSDAEIKRFLTAGYALTDHLCDDFFRHTNTAKRRRQFGRGVTNDVGTAIQGVLGLVVGVPVGVVSGVGLTTGTLDKSWRNYDESFVVAPDLQNVRALVLAAQDDFRRTTLKETNLPTDYMTAQSSVIRYAGFCTFLGMQSLLTQSIDQQRDLLKDKAKPTEDAKEEAPGSTTGTTTTTTATSGTAASGRDTTRRPAAAAPRPARVEPMSSMNAIPNG